MIAIPVLAVLLLAGPQDSAPSATPVSPGSVSTPQVLPSLPKLTPEQEAQRQKRIEEARQRLAPMRKRALHINDLAGNIHSEADARAFVDAVAEELSGHRHLLWTALSIRHRVAHAEWQAVSDPSGLIPEQRIVDVWNEYVREVDAPDEALVTVAEVHNMRDGMYSANRHAERQDLGFSIWRIPNIYALNQNGDVADGCRAVEALKIIHDMHEMFMSVRAARERVQQGLVPSALMKQREQNSPAQPTTAGGVYTLGTSAIGAPSSRVSFLTSYQEPIRPAAFRYQREHGMQAYNQLLRRLFAELFPEN